MKLKETVILFKFKLSTKMKKLFLSLAVVSMSVSFFACDGATEEKKEGAANNNSTPKTEAKAKFDTVINYDTVINGTDTVITADTVITEVAAPAQN